MPICNQILGDTLLQITATATIFLLLIGQKAMNSVCDCFIQLSDK